MKEKMEKWLSMLWRKRRSFLGAGRVEKQLEKINSRIDALSDLLYFHEKFFHKDDVSLSSLVQEEAWGGLHGYRYVMHHLPEKWYETRVPAWQEIFEICS